MFGGFTGSVPGEGHGGQLSGWSALVHTESSVSRFVSPAFREIKIFEFSVF